MTRRNICRIEYGNGDYQPEVLSTELVGRNLNLMVGLIRCMVLMEGVKYECACEWVCVERGGFVGAGGFFVREVKRMTDEQLQLD